MADQNLKKELLDCLLDKSLYKEKSVQYIQRLQNEDYEIMFLIIETCSDVIQSSSTKQPMQRLQALRLIREGTISGFQDFIISVEDSVLELMLKFVNRKEVDKLFGYKEGGDSKLKSICHTFHVMILECIMMWAFYHQNDNGYDRKFVSTYKQLLQKGVQFPTKLNFFKSKLDQEIYNTNIVKFQQYQQKKPSQSNSQSQVIQQSTIQQSQSLQKQSSSQQQVQQTPQGDGNSKEQVELKIKKDLQHLDQMLNKFINSIEKNKDSMDKAVFNQCDTYFEDLLQHIENILNNQFDLISEDLIEVLLEEQNFLLDQKEIISQFKTQQLTYGLFRDYMINLYQQQQGNNNKQQQQQEQQEQLQREEEEKQRLQQQQQEQERQQQMQREREREEEEKRIQLQQQQKLEEQRREELERQRQEELEQERTRQQQLQEQKEEQERQEQLRLQKQKQKEEEERRQREQQLEYERQQREKQLQEQERIQKQIEEQKRQQQELERRQQQEKEEQERILKLQMQKEEQEKQQQLQKEKEQQQNQKKGVIQQGQEQLTQAFKSVFKTSDTTNSSNQPQQQHHQKLSQSQNHHQQPLQSHKPRSNYFQSEFYEENKSQNPQNEHIKQQSQSKPNYISQSQYNSGSTLQPIREMPEFLQKSEHISLQQKHEHFAAPTQIPSQSLSRSQSPSRQFVQQSLKAPHQYRDVNQSPNNEHQNGKQHQLNNDQQKQIEVLSNEKEFYKNKIIMLQQQVTQQQTQIQDIQKSQVHSQQNLQESQVHLQSNGHTNNLQQSRKIDISLSQINQDNKDIIQELQGNLKLKENEIGQLKNNIKDRNVIIESFQKQNPQQNYHDFMDLLNKKDQEIATLVKEKTILTESLKSYQKRFQEQSKIISEQRVFEQEHIKLTENLYQSKKQIIEKQNLIDELKEKLSIYEEGDQSQIRKLKEQKEINLSQQLQQNQEQQEVVVVHSQQQQQHHQLKSSSNNNVHLRQNNSSSNGQQQQNLNKSLRRTQKIFDPLQQQGKEKVEEIQKAMNINTSKVLSQPKTQISSTNNINNNNIAVSQVVNYSDLQNLNGLNNLNTQVSNQQLQQQGQKILEQKTKGFQLEYNDKYFDYLHNCDNLKNFKISCLKQNSVLFENDHIQVIQSSDMQYIKNKAYLKIDLSYQNQTGYDLEYFSISFDEGAQESIKLWLKPITTLDYIPKRDQLSQELIIDFNQVPYHILYGQLEYKWQDRIIKLKIAIPNVITKYLQPQSMGIQEFKRNWSLLNHTIFKTQIINTSPQIARSYHDLISYFYPGYFEVKGKNNDFGELNYRLGGFLEIKNSETQILVRINWSHENQMVIQALNKDNKLNQLQENMIELILQTYTMVFDESAL